jgi:hypothetical protein
MHVCTTGTTYQLSSLSTRKEADLGILLAAVSAGSQPLRWPRNSFLLRNLTTLYHEDGCLLGCCAVYCPHYQDDDDGGSKHL